MHASLNELMTIEDCPEQERHYFFKLIDFTFHVIYQGEAIAGSLLIKSE